MADDVPARSNPLPERGWRSRDAGGGTPTPQAQRRFWLTVLTVLFALCSSVTLIWLLALRPGPVDADFLPIVVGDYDAKVFPPLAFASTDAARLMRHFPSAQAAETKTRTILLDRLEKLQGHAGKPLIVQISALALVWKDKVYLLPADAKPHDPSTWVAIDVVLEAVGKCPEPKLLILDLAHPLADAMLGVLEDRVAETLEKRLEKEPPRYFVLCPCSRGEVALTSETLQGSVFAHYLDLGLKGNANGHDLERSDLPVIRGKRDDSVTLAELFAYVGQEVDRWARMNRLRRQQPRLLGEGKDFHIVRMSGRKLVEPGVEVKAFTEAHQSGWEERDAWFARRVHEHAPPLYRELEAKLLRQERRWRGAIDRASNEADTRQLVSRCKREAQKVLKPTLPVHSVERLVPVEKRKDDLVKKIHAILTRSTEVGKSDEKKDDPLKELEKVLAETKDTDYPQQAWAVLEALNRCAPAVRSQLQLAAKVLAPTKAGHAYVETLTLQYLANREQWKPGAAEQVFDGVGVREKTLATLDGEPALVIWVAGDFEAAESARHKGDHAGAKALYQRLRVRLSMLQRYRSAWNEALTLLPAYARLLGEWPQIDDDANITWRGAAAAAGQLNRLFAPNQKADVAAGIGQVEMEGKELEEHLAILHELLRRRVCHAATGGGPAALEEILCLLETPLPKSRERRVLAKKARQLGRRLQAATDQGEPASAAPRVHARRSAARLQMSLDLLTLARLPEVPTPPRWEPLDNAEKELKELWGKRIFTAWADAASPAQADLFSRFAPLFDPHGDRPLQNHPAHRLRSEQWRRYLSWMEERSRQEATFWSTQGDAGAMLAAFYQAAARDYARLVPDD